MSGLSGLQTVKEETVTRQLHCCIKRTSDRPSRLVDGVLFIYTSNKAQGHTDGTLSNDTPLSPCHTAAWNILSSNLALPAEVRSIKSETGTKEKPRRGVAFQMRLVEKWKYWLSQILPRYSFEWPILLNASQTPGGGWWFVTVPAKLAIMLRTWLWTDLKVNVTVL